jgi:hydroxymethylbilane synthase
MIGSPSSLRIGTRGSPLALVQAQEVADRLARVHGMPPDHFAITTIRTEGDRLQDRSLADSGGKGLFTREIDAALLEGSIDLAVHSMKDVPTVLPPGLLIPCILPREDMRDVLVSRIARRVADLPPGCRIGGSSLRREAQVRHRRPDLTFGLLRGNVGTRLGRIENGDFAATFLAMAGLKRLGIAPDPALIHPVETGDMLPAPAQGAIGVACRAGDQNALFLLGAISHAPSATTVAAERAFLHRLEGSCRTPVAALAVLGDGRLTLEGEVLTPGGALRFHDRLAGGPGDAALLGTTLADRLLAKAGGRLPV